MHYINDIKNADRFYAGTGYSFSCCHGGGYGLGSYFIISIIASTVSTKEYVFNNPYLSVVAGVEGLSGKQAINRIQLGQMGFPHLLKLLSDYETSKYAMYKSIYRLCKDNGRVKPKSEHIFEYKTIFKIELDDNPRNHSHSIYLGEKMIGLEKFNDQ